MSLILMLLKVKDSTPDILPDSSRLYLLPSLAAGSRHPSLRAITADTLAKVRSFIWPQLLTVTPRC